MPTKADHTDVAEAWQHMDLGNVFSLIIGGYGYANLEILRIMWEMKEQSDQAQLNVISEGKQKYIFL